MKLFGTKRRESIDLSGEARATGQPLGRRDVVLGAGVAGAAALATQVLPTGGAEPAAVATVVPSTAAGYRLTAHVKRYYETTKA